MRLSLFIVTFVLGLVISCVAGDSTITDATTTILQGKTWCTVKPGAAEKKLQLFLDANCGSRVNCKEVNRGGSCYEPNTLQNHASYVLNLYYRAFGVCDPDLGLPSITDPSFGRCHFT